MVSQLRLLLFRLLSCQINTPQAERIGLYIYREANEVKEVWSCVTLDGYGQLVRLDVSSYSWTDIHGVFHHLMWVDVVSGTVSDFHSVLMGLTEKLRIVCQLTK